MFVRVFVQSHCKDTSHLQGMLFSYCILRDKSAVAFLLMVLLIVKVMMNRSHTFEEHIFVERDIRLSTDQVCPSSLSSEPNLRNDTTLNPLRMMFRILYNSS